MNTGQLPDVEASDAHRRLMSRLVSSGVGFQLLDHQAEGNTTRSSELRGHDLHEAAKTLVLRVGLSKKKKFYLLAVVPGDRKVDFDAVATLYAAKDVGFASKETAEKLCGSVVGSIIPLAPTAETGLVADVSLNAKDTLYFNTGVLHQSVALSAADWKRIAHPRWARIAE